MPVTITAQEAEAMKKLKRQRAAERRQRRKENKEAYLTQGYSHTQKNPFETEERKEEIVHLIEKTIKCREPESLHAVRGMLHTYRPYMEQALRSVEEKYGPAPGRAWPHPVHHDLRITAYLRGFDKGVQFLQENPGFVENLIQGDEETTLLRLMVELQGSTETVPVEVYRVSYKEALSKIYRVHAPEKLDNLSNLLARTAPHGHQLFRAVVERYTPECLPPSPLQEARLAALQEAYPIPKALLASADTDDGAFEAFILNIVVEYGPEPRDASEHEMLFCEQSSSDGTAHATRDDGLTPLV
eukprot:TRINITY_DN28977_c0_g1_i1.p1 TRINITY_DN28977_c0_g1~~TRINITY_DN28977_c0_g1_i1.p1  ORF type:complete len:300 (+),score=37.52 TRINITY_DN28977_c0_g1_i1:34-933(+)